MPDLTPEVMTPEVLILGAGINGAGLFRDLCEQGISCVIVEKNDYGSGTSSAPSRLIHGGLQYLETGEFRLVAQSTLERNLLLRNAPHTVEALPTLIPIFSYTKGIWAALRTLMGSTTAPRGRGAVLIKIGLSIYDHYGSRSKVMPRHRLKLRRAALQDMPALTPRIVAAGTYYDAKISRPERLVWELLVDGRTANPASKAINYATLTKAEAGTLDFDGPDGAFTVTPKLVVNAAGPWIDPVNASLHAPSKMIGGTKGSHIILEHPALVQALKGQMIYFEADDGRICLVYDFLGRAMVGSTDIKASNPDDVRCEPAEIDYFLDALRSLLPGLAFDRSQIIYAYAGIRPLPANDAANPGLISRDHSAPVIEPSDDRPYPIIALVGGKWTTFRGFAEEVADTVLTRLGRKRRVSTRDLPIGGGKGFPTDRSDWVETEAKAHDLPQHRVAQLLDRYGTTAAQVMGHDGPKGIVTDAPSYTMSELDWILRHEDVHDLSDLVMRRTTLAITGSLTHENLSQIATLAATVLQWTDARRVSEIQKMEALAAKHLMQL
jgi:glycerol-3-phosphate dehydrogenase